MKLLLENWRKYLNEEEEETLPVSVFSAPGMAISVMKVYPGDKIYSSIAHFFQADAFGHAITLVEENLVVIDGAVEEESWYTPDHGLAIEAHEVAHILLGHSISGRNIQQEKEADIKAVELLRGRGYDVAAELLEDRLSSYEDL